MTKWKHFVCTIDGDGVLKDYTLVVRKRNEKDNCKD